jgi:hypothetical protein
MIRPRSCDNRTSNPHRRASDVYHPSRSVAFLVLGSVALAKVEANTDGLVWDKDYPKSTEVFVGLGKYMMSAAGGLEKANYPNIKIDGDLAFMEVVQVDKKRERHGRNEKGGQGECGQG